MNLYLLTQNVNNNYDTYDSCVVAAPSEDEARLINPNYGGFKPDTYSTWAYHPEQVKVQHIGIANSGTVAGIILSSFNAG